MGLQKQLYWDLKNLNSNLNIDPELLTLFNQFITECNKNNIKLIFIYSPEYIEGHRFYLNREEIIDKYKSIAMKNKIPFMDYSTHSMCLDENNFYNYSHLNTSGSKLFTELLATDLLINHQW